MAALAARGDVGIRVSRPFVTATLSESFRDVDVVVHLAGLVSSVRQQDYFTANVDGTTAVARAACAAGTPLVHISSLAAAGPAPASAPRSEDDESQPITAYGRSKLEGERLVRSIAGLNWIVLRPGVVYGPGDRALLPLLRYARLGVLPLVGDPAHRVYVRLRRGCRPGDSCGGGCAARAVARTGDAVCRSSTAGRRARPAVCDSEGGQRVGDPRGCAAALDTSGGLGRRCGRRHHATARDDQQPAVRRALLTGFRVPRRSTARSAGNRGGHRSRRRAWAEPCAGTTLSADALLEAAVTRVTG